MLAATPRWHACTQLLNVREASHSQIMDNQEITHIKKILGLQHGKEYESAKGLRYGHLMIMADQDHDGSHIKGLIINFLDHFFPSLLRVPGFLLEFITPIVKVGGAPGRRRCGAPRCTDLATSTRRRRWRVLAHRRRRTSRSSRSSPSPSTSSGARAPTTARAGPSSTTRCAARRVRLDARAGHSGSLAPPASTCCACSGILGQGLGTSTSAEAKEYFSKLAKHRKPFAPCTAPERELIDMAFNKKKADERKEWLRNFKAGTYMDHSVGEIKVEDFINRELILFSMADNVRYGLLAARAGG